MTLREYFKNRINIFKYGKYAKKNDIAMKPEDTKYGRELAWKEDEKKQAKENKKILKEQKKSKK